MKEANEIKVILTSIKRFSEKKVGIPLLESMFLILFILGSVLPLYYDLYEKIFSSALYTIIIIYIWAIYLFGKKNKTELSAVINKIENNLGQERSDVDFISEHDAAILRKNYRYVTYGLILSILGWIVIAFIFILKDLNAFSDWLLITLLTISTLFTIVSIILSVFIFRTLYKNILKTFYDLQ